MSPKDWQRTRPVLLAAAALGPLDRARLINDSFQDSPALRAEVQGMLSAFDQATRSWGVTPTEAVETPGAVSGPAPLPSQQELLQPGASCGPYRVIRSLGSGAMGHVFLAEDRRLQRRVALKVLTGRWLDSAEARRRLLREARAAAALSHPNVVSVHDVFEDGPRLLLVMEYAEGGTLADLLRSGRPPLAHGLRLVLQIADALAYAHARGVLHCDVKPANVLVTPERTAKVVDFGLARATIEPRDEGPGERDHPKLAGTPAYMAPERFLQGAITPRADVYSLGVVLFEVVTGRRPFDDGRLAALLVDALNTDPPMPSSMVSGVPPALDAVVTRALAKDPAERYQSVDEFAHDVDRVLRLFERPSEIGPLRPAARTGMQLRPTLVLASIAVLLGLATGAGFVTSTLYQSPLGLSGGFLAESPLWWPIWGLRSLVAPLVVVAGTIVAVTLLMIVTRLLVKASGLPDVPGALVEWLTARARGMPGTLLAVVVLGTEIAAIAVLAWRFQAIYWGIDAFIVGRPGGTLSALAPAHRPDHNLLGISVTTVAMFFGWAWTALTLHLGRLHGRLEYEFSFLAGAGALLILLLLLVGQVLPFRILYHNEAERVSFESRPCYLVGQRTSEGLLFCPTEGPPRTRIVALDHPALVREGSYESIFSPVAP